ncbi:hypothetical protein TSACC_3324 [Terrimicrobium sacchariphilum]|uniref:Uncharacterized protein n=1 Tax=Terrimicrobium sacchariphilum TaxID=690879 RepID=A0A146GD65_TERSA|nr:hypothetical protein [Terrimicrobium sacchariphilum]GAT35260.1 hypothetical protein TSACC_3324 [Terrimicrobium sacchariphilum]
MTFHGLVIAHQDSSYDSKRGRIAQETLTCLDADQTVKLTDTVDCVFSAGLIPQASTMVGKTLAFFVDAVRPSNTMRPRFVVKGLAPAKS